MKQIRLKDKILKITACECNHDHNEGFFDCPCWNVSIHGDSIESCNLGGSDCKKGESIPSDCPLEDYQEN